MSLNCIRGQLAALFQGLPPIKPFLLPTIAKAVKGIINATDPYTLASRPCEHVLRKAGLVVRQPCSTGVYIPGLCIFTQCLINSEKTAQLLSKEVDWLMQTCCKSNDQILIWCPLELSSKFPIDKNGEEINRCFVIEWLDIRNVPW